MQYAVLQAVKVNSLGKWKTALQMGAMSAMLAVRRGEAWLGDSAHGEPVHHNCSSMLSVPGHGLALRTIKHVTAF